MQVIDNSVRDFLSTEPSQEQMTKFIESFTPKELKPVAYLHQLDLKTKNTPICLYATLMVQDLRDSHFYCPLIVEKPVNKNSQFKMLKYGTTTQDIIALLENEQYSKVIINRETVICSSVRYQTKWMKELREEKHTYNKIQMVIDGNSCLKLGQVFHSVCIWNPDTEQLHFVREVTPEQAINNNLDVWENVVQKNKIDFQQSKKMLLKAFRKLFQQHYCSYLLYTLISKDRMFISGENIEEIVSELLPNVMRLEIKAPFKQCLFPYKNQKGQLVQTPMQMTTESTFTILDFSNLTTKSQIKISQQQIDNLKALKLFVEEGTTVYRWQYGESAFEHNHSGIVVKASSIINPTFVLPSQQTPTSNPLSLFTQQQKQMLRVYLHLAKELKPTLTQQARKQIENDLKQKKSIPSSKLDLSKLLKLSQLNAMSEGRKQITYEDYINSCKLLLSN